MIQFEDILNHAFSKTRAVYLSDTPPVNDSFKFYEIGIQQNFPKSPKRFLNIFEDKDSGVLGIYIRLKPDQQENSAAAAWIEKSSIKGWLQISFNEEVALKSIKELIDQSYQLIFETMTKADQKVTEGLKDETNHFLFFDKLGREFQDPSRYIFRNYLTTADITVKANCLMRFENNRMIDWTTRIAYKDPSDWKAIIEKAIDTKTQQSSKT